MHSVEQKKRDIIRQEEYKVCGKTWKKWRSQESRIVEILQIVEDFIKNNK